MFCGYDLAKLLGYKNPSIAIHDSCPNSKLIDYYQECYGRVQHLNFITTEEANKLIRKRVANVENYITSLLNGEVPEVKKGSTKLKFAVINLEFSEPQFVESEGEKYEITIKKC